MGDHSILGGFLFAIFSPFLLVMLIFAGGDVPRRPPCLVAAATRAAAGPARLAGPTYRMSCNAPLGQLSRKTLDVEPHSYLAAECCRVPILANPRSGSGKSRRIVEELVIALRGRGLTPALCWQRDELD